MMFETMLAASDPVEVLAERWKLGPDFRRLLIISAREYDCGEKIAKLKLFHFELIFAS